MEKDLKGQVVRVLRIWDMVSRKKSVSYSFENLDKLISSATQEVDEVRDILENASLIKMQPNGTWCLTEKGISYKYKDQKQSNNDSTSSIKESSEMHWTDFRLLLKYYIECLNKEKRSEYWLYPEKYGRDYFIPKTMDPFWLQSPNEDPFHHVLEFNEKEYGMMAAIKESFNQNSSVCVGYPVCAYYDSDGKPESYVPMALIPVKYVSQPQNITSLAYNRVEVYFDFANVSFNDAWVDKYVPREYIRELYRLLEDLNEDGPFDLKKCLPTILKYSNFDNDECDPITLDQRFPTYDRSMRKRSICNTLIIFRTSTSIFTRGLQRELKALLKTPANILDMTALAYVFRKPALPIENNVESSTAIPFIESNIEQLEAVELALNNPIAQLQGPPGTGKSQVAVNLIANCVYRGESVLFSSKNHNAVNAIRDRAQNLIGDNFELVQFCIDEENTRTSWFKNDYKDYQSDLQRIMKEGYHQSQMILDTNLSIKEEILKTFEKEADVRNRVIECFEGLSLAELQLKTSLQLIGKEIDDFSIEGFSDSLRTIKKYFKSGVVGFINRKMMDKSKVKNAFSVLRENYGNLFSEDSPVEEFEKKATKINEQYSKYQKLKDELEEAKKEYSKFPESNHDSLVDQYLCSLSAIKENGIGALVATWNDRVDELEDFDYETIDSIRKSFNDNVNQMYTRHFSREDNIMLTENVHKQFLIEPAWSTTLLSMWLSSPFLPAVFDQIIIDESSQCDVISVIPALFRAKRAIFIGDPEQLQPVITLTESKHDRIWRSIFGEKNSLWGYRYLDLSAYDLFNGKAPSVMLKEHFRCNSGIAEYFNSVFYNNQLRIRTDESKLNFPTFLEDKNSIQWIDVKDSLEGEMDAAVSFYVKLRESGFKGTVGICSPLRSVVNTLQDKVVREGYSLDDVLVETAYKFQGGQRDVIIFVLSYNSDIQGKRNWYISSKENRNLYNVTISRAQALLVVVGDRERARDAGLRELRELALYPRDRVTTLQFDSPWEEKLYNALLSRNIVTDSQRPVLGYRLDLSYEDEYIKLDIEVDGVAYHLNYLGQRKQHDIKRDLALEKEGWVVLRFFVSDLQDDMEYCLDKIESRIIGAKNKIKQKYDFH